MIYSKSKHFIFCHVPKTGGTSIRKLSQQYRRPQESSYFFRICRHLGLSTIYPFYDFYNRPHTTMSRARLLLGEKVYSAAFAFSVVREPKEWLFSCYNFFMLGNSSVKGTKNNISSFRSYIDAMISMKHLKPCQSFLLVDNFGSLLVDDIGRFDQLEEYASHIAEKFEFNSFRLPHLNTNPLSSVSPQLDFLSDLTLLEKIHNEWALDFELWNLVKRQSSNLRYAKLKSPMPTDVNLIEYDPWGMFNWTS